MKPTVVPLRGSGVFRPFLVWEVDTAVTGQDILGVLVGKEKLIHNMKEGCELFSWQALCHCKLYLSLIKRNWIQNPQK